MSPAGSTRPVRNTGNVLRCREDDRERPQAGQVGGPNVRDITFSLYGSVDAERNAYVEMRSGDWFYLDMAGTMNAPENVISGPYVMDIATGDGGHDNCEGAFSLVKND